MERKTILIVEDEPMIAKYIATTVQSAGYDVVSAYDGESGWSQYKKATPDLVLTDIRMPGISGLDLLERIRKEDTKTPVIVVTAFSDSVIAAMRLGANDVVEKPFFGKELSSRIQECISRRDSELDIARLESLASTLVKENEKLTEQIESPSRKQKAGGAGIHQAIWAAAAHNLKAEFLHIGNSAKAVRELADGSREIQEECDLIERSVEYSQLLLRRLLDYIDIGKPRVESISVLELLRRTELLVEPRLPSTVQFKITADPSIRGQVLSADVEQLMGVMLELINNAANVLREKGGIVELKIEAIREIFAISIKDNGPGIPRKLRERLFIEQVPSKNGLGLGLFLSKKIVTAIGGDLNLQSSSNRGTTFTIRLPMTTDRKVS